MNVTPEMIEAGGRAAYEYVTRQHGAADATPYDVAKNDPESAQALADMRAIVRAVLEAAIAAMSAEGGDKPVAFLFDTPDGRVYMHHSDVEPCDMEAPNATPLYTRPAAAATGDGRAMIDGNELLRLLGGIGVVCTHGNDAILRDSVLELVRRRVDEARTGAQQEPGNGR